MFNNLKKSLLKEKQQQIQQEPIKEKEVDFPIPQYNYKQYGLKHGIYYIPDHINPDQSTYLLSHIYQKEWTKLNFSKRRVQKYGGDVEEQGLTNQVELPKFLENLSQTLYLDDPNLRLNHGLINEYEKGIGIYAHKDGCLYREFVNIISLAGPCIISFKKDDERMKILLEPNSLLIFTEEAYKDYMHEIDFVDEDIIQVLFQNQQIIDADVINFKFLDLMKYESTPLKNNPNFNFLIIIKRSKRISITLRHVPEIITSQ